MICIITILLLCSSVILLTNHQHREVAKVVLENIKAWFGSFNEKMSERNQEKQLKREEKARIKEEQKARQNEQPQIKDVSDLKCIEKRDIPIYGHTENESKSQSQPSRKKRVFDAENSSNNIVNHHQADSSN